MTMTITPKTGTTAKHSSSLAGHPITHPAGPVNNPLPAEPIAPERTARFYGRMIDVLQAADLPFLIGGAYSFARYTGIERHTKDLDIFVRPADVERTLAILAAAGCETELTFSHWLAKAFFNDDFIDIIFSSGNGLATVHDDWFTHAAPDEVLGRAVLLCPLEESLWVKAFVMERERFDGADVMHLLLHNADRLDWPRLVGYFHRHEQLLLAHLHLFQFIYPTEAGRIPAAVMEHLSHRARHDPERARHDRPICRGTLISREQYLPDVEHGGFTDARLTPEHSMSRREIAEWTDAIDDEQEG
jgi:hypothetical protein